MRVLIASVLLLALAVAGYPGSAQSRRDSGDLQARVQALLALHSARPLYADRESPWHLLHGILVFGPHARVAASGGVGEASALEWISTDRPVGGQHLFEIADGRIAARWGTGAQAHAGQALAVFAQAGVPIEHPIVVAGRPFRVSDLVAAEQDAAGAGRDSTFQLIGLSHYLGSDAEWRRADGETWSIARLLEAELASPVSSGACGGSHRLMGLAAAVRARRASGVELDGSFARARWMLLEYQREAYREQNPDGSFSTRWFEGGEANEDLDRRLETTGHVLEWISASADGEAIRDPRLRNAVTYLSGLLGDHPERSWEDGPLAHALRGLSTWNQRTFSDAEISDIGVEVP